MRQISLQRFALTATAFLCASGCEEKPWAPVKASSSAPLGKSPVSAAASVTSGDTSAFTELVVECESSRARLAQNQSKTWQVVEPFPSLADAATVKDLLEAVDRQSFQRVLHATADTKTLAQLGLAPPQLTLKASGYGPPVQILGGLENSFDGSIPAQRNDDPAIYRLDGAFRVSVCKDADSFRAKNLLSVDENAVEELVLKRKSSTLRIERGSDRQWRLGPLPSPLAEKAAVAGLLASLRRARVLKFFEDSTLEATRLGLNLPAAQLRLGFRDGGLVEYTVSDTLKEEPRHIAIRRRDSSMASTSLAIFEKASLPLLFEPFTSFRDQALLKFDPQRVNRLMVQTKSAPALVLERNLADAGSTSWQVVAPSKGPAQQFKVAALLFALSSLRPLRPSPEQRPHSNQRRQKPSVIFSLFVDGQRVAELSVEDEEAPDRGWSLVQTPEGRYQVERSARTALTTDLAVMLSDAGP